MILLEQFIARLPEVLAIWFKEKEPKSLMEAAELANIYVLAREDGREVQRRPHLQGQPLAEAVSRNLVRLSPEAPTEQKGGGGQTNQHGEKRFQCNRFGHMMYNCLYKKTNTAARPKALYGGTCCEPAWNEQSYKYLQRGRQNGHLVQMLVNTGADQTMVAANCVELSKVEGTKQVPVVCVHRDTVSYPTAEVHLQMGTRQQQARVVVALELPVAVLLG